MDYDTNLIQFWYKLCIRIAYELHTNCMRIYTNSDGDLYAAYRILYQYCITLKNSLYNIDTNNWRWSLRPSTTLTIKTWIDTDKQSEFWNIYLSSSDFLGVNTFLDIIISIQFFKQCNSSFCLCDTFHSIWDNKWYFWNLFNFVSTCHHKGWKSCGSNARYSGKSSLVLVDMTVPSTPDSCWCKHTSTTAHLYSVKEIRLVLESWRTE